MLTRARPDDLEEPPAPVGPSVVLVPGVYETWRFMWALGVHLHAHGVRVHVVPELGLNRAPIPDSAAVLGAYLARHDLRDVVLVAHSKGGLIGKLAMTSLDPEGRVASLVAVNSPFGGSKLARLIPLAAVRTFAPKHPAIVALDSERAVNARITSVRSRWDPHIPGAGDLDGAKQVILQTPGHFRPVTDPGLERLLLTRLTEQAGEREI